MISPQLEQWLDAHINFETGKLSKRATMPTLERMQLLCKYMGDPQEHVKAIHITGTNGKTSTTRITESLLRTKGLYVGAISSPHLSYMNERICLDGKPVDSSLLEHALTSIRDIENSVDVIAKDPPSYFEIFVAAAYEIMSHEAVDVGVIEVGMGGLYDATNVCATEVAVITNVELDHMAYLGNTREKIATEKSGIIKPDNRVVIGETDENIVSIFLEAAHKVNATALVVGQDFEILSNEQAVGGRLMSMRTPYATYRDVFLPLFGAHQASNAMLALVAAESFIDAALGEEVVIEGFNNARSPGRMEILEREPLVLIDGAHNVAGAQALATALEEEFERARRIYVFGLTEEKDATAMINALGIDNDDIVIATAADTARAMEVGVLSQALRDAGVETVIEVNGPLAAIENAKALALDDDHIIVTGSLYVVGAVRSALASS
ncbi:MAG TPA: folylpolyglutamate synthase/dihydrofolate synthase family protein [Acidimicrobiia bacterium]|nr:folylpolyglutamate synthase/dihydrofolate synthase family protein [Acidimicrobiia bacterium]